MRLQGGGCGREKRESELIGWGERGGRRKQFSRRRQRGGGGGRNQFSSFFLFLHVQISTHSLRGTLRTRGGGSPGGPGPGPSRGARSRAEKAWLFSILFRFDGRQRALERTKSGVFFLVLRRPRCSHFLLLTFFLRPTPPHPARIRFGQVLLLIGLCDMLFFFENELLF